MASLVPENLECIKGRDDLKRPEFREMDELLFTSSLEEPQDEGFSDERLHSIIQSLEAEINQNSVETHDLPLDVEMLINEEHGAEYEYQYSVSNSNNLFFEYDDMELEPSSHSENMKFYSEGYGYEIDSLAEFGDISDSLWQETCDAVIYG